ncbi:hypothetical protein SISSUDRAFT_1038139 [Sistotremastrum suecicum HHB10207 ss-3]|uniref:Uncharacterized protein n=1 Tax=Sistotremastrum suecicum HHB10207 ss-3 TaxID=1314776 RepID=A0A165X655_9AGAM|nr:hypothetical protein SISSUDRAFT_1038139 [Sistotremastrum suecicum HHB10207 ss-3]
MERESNPDPPTLPGDVQRIIVEMLAVSGKAACLNLCLVSRDFAAWVFRILYFSLNIRGYMQMCDLFTEIDPSRLGFVRHLFIGTKHELDQGLLNRCHSITHLMVYTFGAPLFGKKPPRLDTPFWAGTTFPSNVSILEADCSIFSRYELPTPAVLTKWGPAIGIPNSNPFSSGLIHRISQRIGRRFIRAVVVSAQSMGTFRLVMDRLRPKPRLSLGRADGLAHGSGSEVCGP